jgi:very-short-patch-repair endonuclease
MEPVTEVTDALIFQSSLPNAEKLERARTQLLDLSARNRLLNMPRTSKSSAISVVDEKAAEIYRLLVRENKAFTFLPGKAAAGEGVEEEADAAGDEPDEIDQLAQPDDDGTDERGVLLRHTDTKLQTRLTGKGLQKRLLELYLNSKTLEEEQGVNVLYATLGALKWVDPNKATNIRYAPLVLIPVELSRGTAGERFRLKARLEDVASNLSLEAYLDRVHKLRMPVFDATEAFDIDAYCADVARTVSEKQGWEVLPDEMTVGFFSFAKFLMYRDLDPAIWPKGNTIVDRALVKGLLSDGFPGGEGMLDEGANIDPVIPPVDMLHILDCDSSQAIAIREVRRGRDMVIQGPPGTGKSQTIANVIASAIKDGKTVLFVAEKMAALEVVKRRLDEKGVGDACLELHSNKANKRAVLEELRRTWELGAPKAAPTGTLISRLTDARDELNAHVSRLHSVDPASGLSPFQVMGHLSRLRQAGVMPNDVALEGIDGWGADGFERRHALLSDLVTRIDIIGKPDDHAFTGVGVEAMAPTDRERLVVRVDALRGQLDHAREHMAATAAVLEAGAPLRLNDVAPLSVLAQRMSAAPVLDAEAMAHEAWTEASAVDALLGDGHRFAALRQALSAEVTPGAWDEDTREAQQALAALPEAFDAAAIQRLASVRDAIPGLVQAAKGLSHALGRECAPTTSEFSRMAKIGERVANAPPASPETFASELWEGGVERAGGIANTVADLEVVRVSLAGQIQELAWDIDVVSARAVLAAKGTGLLRYLSGEWRAANKLMRSVLTNPAQPLPVTLASLDTLIRGQEARRVLSNEDSFARAAFGGDWQGERSASAPLIALVEWMRSLRGLGAEPRLIASRGPEKDDVAQRSKQVNLLLAQLAPDISGVHADFLSRSAQVFGDATGPEQVDLESLLQLAVRHTNAWSAASRLLVAPPGNAGLVNAIFDRLDAGRGARQGLQDKDMFGRALFGSAWNGLDSDWDALSVAAAWVHANGDIRALAGRVSERSALIPRARVLDASIAHLTAAFRAIADELNLDLSASVGADVIHDVHLDTLGWRLSRWVAEQEELHRWVTYRDRAARAIAEGCGDVVARLADGRLATNAAVAAFEFAYFEGQYRRVLKAEPALGRFDGVAHGHLVREFADLDRQRIVAASGEVVRAHHQNVPRRDSGSIGPLGVLRGEIQKKKGHIALRKLVERAGPALTALKPVFMMSPLSVAQFLPPGAMEFDLLVMDEASQIQPVDALGAVARAKQVVVVGDPRQLPPTNFFAKMTSGDEEIDEDEPTKVGDVESILGLFTARGLPMRMLRWHYRSRHQSLIAVSNRQFYENKLFIVPSPWTQEGGRGLRFHHVRDGVFGTPVKSVNAPEARMVAEAIVEHARLHPKLSLGVAAFSATQSRAINDELEVLRRTLPPETEAFFNRRNSEPFFIKNLENVQGDERDVIFISVGYGPTVPGGKVPMRFGPLNNEGGERRLNVLISRAKQRCEVFSSMTDENIDPSFSANRKGIEAFRIFLRYARTGKLDTAAVSGRDFDSVFEEQVATALEERGYEVHRQVGLAGFFIDLAITDPERPGRFLLGIECDGASYHSAQSARDRDRLRQQVLEDHGWNLHRIWSTDWFQRPQEQLDLVCRQIDAARASFDEHAAEEAVASELAAAAAVVEREERAADGDFAFAMYVEASPRRPMHRTEEIHEIPTGILTALAVDVVRTEGPVHTDEVIARIRDAWGAKRAGSRIQIAVEKAIDVAVRQGHVEQDGAWLSMPGATIIPRDRSEVASVALRKAEYLPEAELAAAVLLVVERNFGASRDQVVERVARAMGIRAISAQVRERIAGAVDHVVLIGRLTDDGGLLTVASR